MFSKQLLAPKVENIWKQTSSYLPQNLISSEI